MSNAMPRAFLEKASGLPLSQLAGQLLGIGFEGPDISPVIKGYIKEFAPGGIVLFAQNLLEPPQVKSLTGGLQKLAGEQGLLPFLLCVDQEGGVVARLKPPFTLFEGNPAITNESLAVEFGHTCGRELKEAGFTVNFAPVVDVLPLEGESIMKSRAFPGPPQAVARLGAAVVRSLQETGIMAVAKHFPGIGSTVLDSHKELPVCPADMDRLTRWDLVPFYGALSADAGGVMLSHILYPALDPVWPASLSVEVVKNLLRGEMGYDGVVFTDDLDMGAIEGRISIETCMERLLEADADMALICHQGPDIALAHKTLLELVEKSPALRQSAIISAARIMAAKHRFCSI
ncbi:MAG: glycoside hydrolase family 3 N-terminal domain-containing protein [Desulfatibacillaceae bacterium]|nr:glycoside hydrolase family 3 N-terminal domain-containing protein [Desulfatibacillaceae bacterium]